MQFWCGHIQVKRNLIDKSGVGVRQARMRGGSQGRWWDFSLGN